MLVPYLTEYDPETNSEGSLDPLGTYTIADRIAVKIVPGFRERMRHPRFLTAIAAGSVICKDFGGDVYAKDEVSEPWQVYEWYVVQALVKEFKGTDEIRGLPGSDKAGRAMEKRLPLNAARYLKTASVFGFHGVYRTLAHNIDLINDFGLGEGGDKLVRAWENDQELNGFYAKTNGFGHDFKKKFYTAVRNGLDKGEVAYDWSWSFFSEIASRLSHSSNRIGQQERKVLIDLITNDNRGYRERIINGLIEFSEKGNEDFSEMDFHDYLIKKVPKQLTQYLTAIKSYEQFSRCLLNSFEDILFLLSSRTGKVDLLELSKLNEVCYAAENISNLFKKVSESLSEINEGNEFADAFGAFNDILSPGDYTKALLEHHFNVQKNKPPYGKLPWIEQIDNSRMLIRTTYNRSKTLVASRDQYVHFYRMNPLSTFLKDLKKIK